jgi:hypothetical protein
MSLVVEIISDTLGGLLRSGLNWVDLLVVNVKTVKTHRFYGNIPVALLQIIQFII